MEYYGLLSIQGVFNLPPHTESYVLFEEALSYLNFLRNRVVRSSAMVSTCKRKADRVR